MKIKNLLLLLMLLPITAVSQTTINGIHYYLNRNNKTAIVTHVHYSNDYEGSVVIPSKVKYQGEEYQVTEIGKDAFANCYNLTSVTIPDGVTTISRYAFSECYSLTTISIPQSVKIIGEGAFSWCEKLTSITLPNIGLIQERTFERCKSITSIIIPRSVVSIGYMAFYQFGNNATITILRENADIGGEVLSGSSVKAIYVPKGSLNWYKSRSCFSPDYHSRIKEINN